MLALLSLLKCQFSTFIMQFEAGLHKLSGKTLLLCYKQLVYTDTVILSYNELGYEKLPVIANI
jgi:hypothetical protein